MIQGTDALLVCSDRVDWRLARCLGQRPLRFVSLLLVGKELRDQRSATLAM
jgi:hypothetical protein